MSERVRVAVGVGLAVWLSASLLAAQEAPAPSGEVCLAAFKVSATGELAMDLPGPGPGSKYTFRFDKKTDVTLGEGDERLVAALPADRRMLVEVRLDGKRTEAYWLDLRDHQRGRACLWLYRGYWHWAVTQWDDRQRGCHCWDEAAG